MKRRLIAVLLVFILVLSLIPTGVQAKDEKIYTDSRGNKITIPGGADSCAVEVVSFTEGDPWTARKNSQGTGNILGEPDYRSIDDGSYITLGTGGVIVLKFKVDIIDGPGDDIYVFEVGPNVEGTKVEVSADNEKWIFAGNVEGSISAVDLSGKVSKGARFKYVRITDLKTSPGGEYSGADIDAVAGLNAKVEPISSAWAKTELDKADEYGLIPDILQGADMTRPITREEFAELAVKLYEKTMNTAAVPASPNPFKDTANHEILKAFKLGVTTGTSATTFAPKELTNREQVATMLSRAIRTMAPGGDFSTSGAPTFNDRKDISKWALDHVLFMSRLGIIKGTDGKFMPKATTTAQTAAGYATTTREQAIAMSVRSFEQMNAIKGSKGTGAQQEPAVTPALAKGSAESSDISDWLIGTWGYSTSNGGVHLDIMYEFREDGTYYRIIAPLVMYVRTGNVFEGKYKVSGDKLILSDTLKSIGPAKSHFDKIWYFTIESYTTRNITWENEEWKISRTDDGTLMIGDMEFNRGR